MELKSKLPSMITKTTGHSYLLAFSVGRSSILWHHKQQDGIGGKYHSWFAPERTKTIFVMEMGAYWCSFTVA